MKIFLGMEYILSLIDGPMLTIGSNSVSKSIVVDATNFITACQGNMIWC